MHRFYSKVRHFITHNFIWVGLVSLAWLVIRSGAKPSRLQYPCQRAALSSSSLLLGAFALPAAARGLKYIGIRVRWTRRLSRVATIIGIVLIAALAVLLVVRMIPHRQAVPAATAVAASPLPAWNSTADFPSRVFVIDSFPSPDTARVYHEGLDTLLSLLASQGIYFYKSNQALPWCDSTGIIGKNDVVLLKVNAEWDQRGQTNGDLIKGVIARILAHPDTFTGEVELVENGQWRCRFAYPKNNSEDTNQTMQGVVDRFADQGYHVGAYDWTLIGYGSNNHWVSEFNQGDTVSGYVREDSSGMTYAKFTSRYGTQVSVRLGVWNGSAYEPERLKFINMPVLKSHSLMGVTASVKHYIGFLDYYAIGANTMHTRAMSQGLLGVNFGKARFPDLNIIDATWVMGELSTGPSAPYNLATRLNTLVASRDPIANDWYAGKHVIRPNSWWSGHAWLHDYGRMDPDNLNTENPGSNRRYAVDSTPCSGMPYNAFHQMLVSSRDKMLAYGKQVTMDSSQMSVHVFSFRHHTAIQEPEARGPSPAIEVSANPGPGPVRVQYQLARSGKVRITVLNSTGRVVRELCDITQTAGTHVMVWDRHDTLGQQVPAGNYIIRMDAGQASSSARVTILR